MTLRLFYGEFPFWRAETCRLALHLGGIEFEDIRMKPEDWQRMKATGELPEGGYAPFWQVPVLEVDGKPIAQTAGIARFCGKLAGLYPRDNDFLAAKVDEVLDAATAITNEIFYDSRGKEGDDKLRARQALTQDYLPKWLGFLERLLNENAESGWFVGESMSIADLAMWRLLGWLTSGVLDGIPKTLLVGFNGLQELHNRVDSLPKVREWMERHYGK